MRSYIERPFANLVLYAINIKFITSSIHDTRFDRGTLFITARFLDIIVRTYVRIDIYIKMPQDRRRGLIGCRIIIIIPRMMRVEIARTCAACAAALSSIFHGESNSPKCTDFAAFRDERRQAFKTTRIG